MFPGCLVEAILLNPKKNLFHSSKQFIYTDQQKQTSRKIKKKSKFYYRVTILWYTPFRFLIVMTKKQNKTKQISYSQQWLHVAYFKITFTIFYCYMLLLKFHLQAMQIKDSNKPGKSSLFYKRGIYKNLQPYLFTN